MIINTDLIKALQPTYTNLLKDKAYSGCVKHGKLEYTYEPKDQKDPTKGIRLTATAFSKFVSPGYTDGHIYMKEPASQLLLWVYGYKTLPSRVCVKRETEIQIKKPEDTLASCFTAAAQIYDELQGCGSKPSYHRSLGDGDLADFLIEEGAFLCKDIVQERYIAQLATSPNFGVKIHPNGNVESFWDTNG